MRVYMIDKHELKKAYLRQAYDCSIEDLPQEIDSLNYDVILLSILLDNFHLTQTKAA